ncbi:helix-turn-helix transcriptional regulator [Lentzea sp. CC55]|uniref:helix-turn-helix transcriptional regulator n=1 Tax=Lentzea sp. CC55 TaxID=2884909 RepID=UPI001F2D7DC6|nr:helix-turn-helix transcriptional regulator [Lentzea sp. CC55]MCG8927694.1 helix-turn-helix transcriptional regulator [Lentzea sp. CC55]
MTAVHPDAPCWSRRPAEASSLERYFPRRGEADVELPLPERHDPVVVASLIGADAMARGRSVMCVTSDDQVDHVLERLAVLPGPEAVDLHRGDNPLRDLVAHHTGQALGVSGFSSYFGPNPGIDPADVVVLDADRMNDTVIGALFAVRVDRRTHPSVHRRLRELIGDVHAPQVLEPARWKTLAARVCAMLTPVFCGEDTRFAWLRLQPFLPECRVVVGVDDIVISPPGKLLHALPGYRHARQRVHLRVVPTPAAEAGGEPDVSGLSPSIRYAVDYLRTCFTDPDLTLNRVASVAYMSRYHFSRSFHEQTGHRFIDFVTSLRMDEARLLLRESSTSITEVARAVGYRELSHFQRMFKKRFGMSASAYRTAAGN